MAHEHGKRDWRFPWSGAPSAVARREPGPVPADWRGTLRSRVFVCAAVFATWTAAIEARLLYLQVYDYGTMMARANRQQLKTVKLPGKRGEVFDRSGHVLAYSVDADTIAADPSAIAEPAMVAREICAVLDDCDPQQRQTMAERLGRKSQQFAFLDRRVSLEETGRVKALALPGMIFYKESRRYYPKKELAAHVLGYVGIDNVGLAGVESTFDDRIRGREGKILLQADARRNAMSTREERLPTAGDGLELTIDEYLQHIAERELRAGVEANNALSGSALIMQPQTGEILALANWPTFNPNAFGRAGVDERRNRAVQDLYEPGSTFKVVTASAALEEGVIVPEDPIDCAPGHISFGSRVIRDTHAYGVLPFTDVIVKSSNVGAIKVGMRLGSERLGRYINRFGFGQALAPDFRGENPGIVWNAARLDPSALASVSMGYQVGVTPLQMAAAVSAVANGGNLIEPRVVRAFIRNGRREEVPHKTLRRAISAETAATLTAIMEAVVERGTGTAAKIEGHTIAGKTGTAQKLINRAYSKSEYNASFVGFVPSRNPAITIVVVIDSPHGHGYYGGTVAAPIFQRIAEAALRRMGVAPTVNAPPPVMVARHETESAMAPRPAMSPGIERTTERAVVSVEHGIMPDLRGLSAREAVRTLTRAGLTARIDGQGFVLDQMPQAGSALDGLDACVLKLGRRPVPAAGGAPQ